MVYYINEACSIYKLTNQHNHQGLNTHTPCRRLIKHKPDLQLSQTYGPYLCILQKDQILFSVEARSKKHVYHERHQGHTTNTGFVEWTYAGTVRVHRKYALASTRFIGSLCGASQSIEDSFRFTLRNRGPSIVSLAGIAAIAAIAGIAPAVFIDSMLFCLLFLFTWRFLWIRLLANIVRLLWIQRFCMGSCLGDGW